MNKKILLIAVIASQPVAADWSFDVGAGISTYKTAHDGLWYQEKYPHALDMQSQALSLGVSYKRNDIRYRADFLMAGWVYSSAQVTSDFGYYTGTHLSPGGVMKGRGHADGVALTVSKDIGFLGLPLYAEAGLWAYKPVWKVTAYTFDRSKEAEIEGVPEWRFGPAIGLGLRYKAIDLSLRYLDMQNHGETSTQPIFNGAYVFMVKVCL